MTYISGPMTGLPDYNKKAFDKAERFLQCVGHKTVNPHDITNRLGETTYEEYLKADIIEMLTKCNAIYMLKGFEQSKGAKLELEIAKACGLNVMFDK